MPGIPGLAITIAAGTPFFRITDVSFRTARTSLMLSRARKNLSEENSLNRFSMWRLLKMRCRRKSGTGRLRHPLGGAEEGISATQ